MDDCFLIDGDNCLTIISKSSIIFDPKNPELKVRMTVTYLCPESTIVKKKYTAVIVHISCGYICT